MYKGKKIIHIVAVNALNAIGKDGKLIWYCKEDLLHFKASTIGNILIVGSTTAQGMPNVVNQGRYIFTVSSKGPNKTLEQALDKAVELANEMGKKEIFIMGGASIYKQTSPFTDKAIVSLIDNSEMGDTFYHVPDHLKEYHQDVKQEFTIFYYSTL